MRPGGGCGARGAGPHPVSVDIIYGEWTVEKNEIRYMRESDTIEGKKWYQEVIDFIKDEVRSMMELIQ